MCPSRPECPDAGLHRFDVFPAANRADELGAVCARPGDAGVRDQLPLSPVRPGDLPSVVGAARVPEGRSLAEGLRDHLRRPLAGDVVHFNLDAEGLVFHGVCSFRPAAAFPARPVAPSGRFPARRVHQSLRRAKKSSSFFAKKEAALPLIYARRRRKKVFGKPGFFRQPGTPAAGFPLSDFALVKSGRAHFPALLWESVRAAHFRTLLWKSPPGGASPLCREEVAGGHSSSLCSGEVAGRVGVPTQGVVRSPCVPGGDRAPLTREFPTNSGVGVSAPKGIKKTVPKDGEGDDGMRLLSDVGLVAAGGLIWNPHNDQPLIQRGKQIQFAEVIPRF